MMRKRLMEGRGDAQSIEMEIDTLLDALNKHLALVDEKLSEVGGYDGFDFVEFSGLVDAIGYAGGKFENTPDGEILFKVPGVNIGKYGSLVLDVPVTLTAIFGGFSPQMKVQRFKDELVSDRDFLINEYTEGYGSIGRDLIKALHSVEVQVDAANTALENLFRHW